MMSQLAGPIYTGDDVVAFCSEKDYYSMSLLGAASVPKTMFAKIVGSCILQINSMQKNVIHSSDESNPVPFGGYFYKTIALTLSWPT